LIISLLAIGYEITHGGCSSIAKGTRKLRRRSNERLHEYHSFDELFIAPLSPPGFPNSTICCCAEYVGAQFGYLKCGPESKILMAALSEHLLNTDDSNVYQALLQKTDLRLAKKVS